MLLVLNLIVKLKIQGEGVPSRLGLGLIREANVASGFEFQGGQYCGGEELGQRGMGGDSTVVVRS